ncbi:UNVERIFIED_CONTAM: hypothetical protein HDU68_008773 [Siphonaria sp. JEL0065]|nr:hypothetical protein HDU68_008773 [Siphonaria sp. JEL0065]
MRMLEEHHATATGQPVKHSLFKELLAGFAAAQVEKMIETHSLRERGVDIEKLKADAQAEAIANYEKQGIFDFFSGSSNEHHEEVKKGNFGHEILAGAAGFEAMRLLEQHQATANGQPVKHSFFKELLAGFAAAQVEKYVETHALRDRGVDVEKLKADAVAQAHANYDKQYGHL